MLRFIRQQTVNLLPKAVEYHTLGDSSKADNSMDVYSKNQRKFARYMMIILKLTATFLGSRKKWEPKSVFHALGGSFNDLFR